MVSNYLWLKHTDPEIDSYYIATSVLFLNIIHICWHKNQEWVWVFNSSFFWSFVTNNEFQIYILLGHQMSPPTGTNGWNEADFFVGLLFLTKRKWNLISVKIQSVSAMDDFFSKWILNNKHKRYVWYQFLFHSNIRNSCTNAANHSSFILVLSLEL